MVKSICFKPNILVAFKEGNPNFALAAPSVLHANYEL